MNWFSRNLHSTLVIIFFLAGQTGYGLRILGLFPLAGKSHFVTPENLLRTLAKRGHQVDVYSHFPLKKPPPNYNDFSLAGSSPIFSNNMSFEFVNKNTGASMSKVLSVVGNPTCEIMSLPIFQKLIKDPPKNPPYDIVITEVRYSINWTEIEFAFDFCFIQMRSTTTLENTNLHQSTFWTYYEPLNRNFIQRLFVSNCYLAWGRHLNIPLIGIVSNSLYDWLYDPLGNPQNFALDASKMSGLIAPMTFYERLINTLMSTYVINTFNYYVREQDAYVEKFFGPGFPNVVDLQKDLALILTNSHHALNGIKAYTAAVVPVGGLHISDTNDQLSQSVQKFLDESKHGFVYVSFGSMVMLETFPKFVLDAFYGTFKNIAPVRVLMKIAKPDVLPPRLPSNVITQTWLPQVTVLKHKNIKGFITHGGLMGTQESIYFGIPMVGIPLFGDQHFNMKSYVRKNLALKLEWENISERSLTEAVKAIIENPVYKKSAEKVGRAFRDVPMSPKEVAVFWVEYIARHGKNALRSPLVDMPWWQASLLDVYGFIIVIVLLVLYAVKRILSFLSGIVLSRRKPISKLKKN